MPAYTYKCKHCFEEMIEVHSIFDEPKIICPKCQEPTLVRLIKFAPVVIYRGEGWVGKISNGN